jgi:hypothetical protein
VQSVALGELRWEERVLDLTQMEGAPAVPAMEAEVVRITLRGSASLRLAEAWAIAWRQRLASCLAADVRDETVPELGEAELQALRLEHALLTEVLDDLQSLAPGQVPRFPAEELAGLAETAGGPLHPALLVAARRMLLHEFRETCASC